MIKKICSVTLWGIKKLEFLSPVSVLLMRIWMAKIFWLSGLSKLSDWEGTVALFRDEYKTPLLSPELAATLGTATELIAPVLLVLGLGARIGAASMLFMTAVIEYTYMHFDIHVVWAQMLLLIVLQGPGRLSVDHYIRANSSLKVQYR